MTLDPLFAAGSPVPSHAIAALLCVVLGAVQLAMKKGTAKHRALGYVWITLMLYVAISGFFINSFRWIGPFGPIHILSAFAVYLIWTAITAIRRGDVIRHQKKLVSLYIYGCLVAGLFTFLPDRVMHRIITTEAAITND